MCDPVTLGVAVAAVVAANTISSYVGEKQAYAANKTAANLNYANEKETLSAKASQLDAEHSEKAEDTAIATVQNEGRIAASASDQGLAPTSIIQAINAGSFGIGRQATVDDTNFANQRQQLGRDATGAEISRQTQINSKSKPTALGLAIGLGGNVVQGFTTASKAKG